MNFRELWFPVQRSRLRGALRLYVHDFLKLPESFDTKVEPRGNQGDYVVYYTPRTTGDLPVVRNSDWKDNLDDFQKAALDMADATEKLRRQYGPHGQHPYWERTDWCAEAAQNNTQLGYWEWVVHRLEENAEND